MAQKRASGRPPAKAAAAADLATEAAEERISERLNQLEALIADVEASLVRLTKFRAQVEHTHDDHQARIHGAEQRLSAIERMLAGNV